MAILPEKSTLLEIFVKDTAMGSKQLTFPKIENLPKHIKLKLDAMLFEKKGVTAGAKFLATLIEFPSSQSCYAYVRDYKAYLAAAYADKKLIPPDLADIAKLKIMEAIDITQKQVTEAVELTKQIKLNARELKPVKDFVALQEMTLLAFTQKERTLRMLDQEDSNIEAGMKKPYIPGVRENLESTFTMFAKIAQMQMDQGIIHKQDTSAKHLHLNVSAQQEELVRRFNEQQTLSDMTTKALEIILRDDTEMRGDQS